MNNRALLAILAFLGLVAPALAQVSLDDFSAAQPTFLGDWSGTPGVGVYSFVGSTDDTMGAEFTGAWNLAGYDALAFTAQIDAGTNTASSFSITLLDSHGESATGTFLVSSFDSANLATVQAALTPSGGFDFANVTSWRLGGGEFLGTATLALTAGQLSAVSAVPEPAAAAALAGLAMLGWVAWRRRAAPMSGHA